MANVILKGTYEGYEQRPDNNGGTRTQIGVKQGLNIKRVTIKPESINKFTSMKQGQEVALEVYVSAFNNNVYFKEI